MTIDQSTHPKRKWSIQRATWSRRGRRTVKHAIIESASTNYRNPHTIGFPPASTTDAILQDPVWRRRLLDSLEQARRGQTRPIEEYWTESDAEDG